MPTHYQYKGQHYQLPDGLSNEEALARIKAHLGEAEPANDNQKGSLLRFAEGALKQIPLTAMEGSSYLTKPLANLEDAIAYLTGGVGAMGGAQEQRAQMEEAARAPFEPTRDEGMAGSVGRGAVNAVGPAIALLGGPAGLIKGGFQAAGIPGATRAALPLAGKAAAGAAVGGVAGSIPLPFLGKLGAREGAILGGGIAINRNPGGTGALFKHGAKVKGLKALLRALGIAAEDEAAAGGAARAATKAAGRGAAEGMEGGVIQMKPTRTITAADKPRVAVSAAKSASKSFLEFAKREGKNYKRGQRVFFVKDAGGNPVQTFDTAAKANGWLRRAENRGKGFEIDFFTNLWS